MRPNKKEITNIFSRSSKRKASEISDSDKDEDEDISRKKTDNISSQLTSTRSMLYRDDSPSIGNYTSSHGNDSDDDILDRMFNQLSTDEYPITPESTESTRSQNQTSKDSSFGPVQFDDRKASTQPNLEITKPQTSKKVGFSIKQTK